MAKVKDKKEEHITVLPETFEKLKFICGKDKRTYRAEVTMMIDKRYDELKGVKNAG